MQMHLLLCRSADLLSRNLRLHNIEMLMLIMEELQKTYTVASIYRGIFVKAIQQLFPTYRPCTSPSAQAVGPIQENATNPSTSLNAGPITGDSFEDSQYGMGAVFNDGLVDALMDHASLFNIWEHWESS